MGKVPTGLWVVEVGGFVMVPDVEVVPGVPVREDDDEGHPSPWVVTVTVTAATVDTTVVVDHEVTADAGHCELVVDNVWDLLAVPLVEEPDVEEPDVEGPVVAEELGPPEDVGPFVVEEVLDTGTPHSSKLWPFATVSMTKLARNQGRATTYIFAAPHLAAKFLPGAVVAPLASTYRSR